MDRRILVLSVALGGCAIGTGTKGFNGNNSADGGAGLNGNNGSNGSGPTVIYAHSDTELYVFDPSSNAITDVGAFNDGSGSAPTITDLAVDSEGNVWVNSETAIYRASVPQSPGDVTLTLVSNIAVGSGQKFYALGFAPQGVLGSGETLVAGDNAGVLYAISDTGQTTELGGFGGTYQLSGDVMFFTQNGTPRGLATIRACTSSSSCTTSNDILAEIDVPAMQQAYQSKTPAASLRKQLLGSGTGYGHLYGVGAWNSQVYAFARVSGSTPAQLISIDSSGAGSVVQQFGQITSGWSGAGVTTAAKVTVLPN